MKKLILSVIIPLIMLQAEADAQTFYSEPFAHTYSIVARDPETGEMGVAVQSHWFSVGSVVSWAEAGVGAIATQSLVNVSFGPRGLDLLKEGKTAEEALQSLIDSDEGRDYRQVAIVDIYGNVAAWTGKKCMGEAGHQTGDQFSCQANMMLNASVWPAMTEAFENSQGKPLAERMMSALDAAEGEDGDIRGKQSAAILVVKGEATGNLWEDRIIDLRVEDHPDAPAEIRRILNVYRAYEHMNAGDLAIEHNDVDGALREYGAAQAMFPDNLEMQYWTAISLANAGRMEEALPILKKVFEGNNNWRILTGRLPVSELLNVSDEELETILNL